MAIQSPALSVGLATLFGDIHPALEVVKRLGGSYDFSDGPDGIVLAPAGETVKVPIASVDKANAYNASTNNYFTGADTAWAEMTPTLYLKGYDITGVDVDKGCDAKKFENLFTRRASKSIGLAIIENVYTAFVTNALVPGELTAYQYTLPSLMTVGTALPWIDRTRATLVVGGGTWGKIKATFAVNHAYTDKEIINAMGFADIVVLPQISDGGFYIVPDGSFGIRGAVPTAVAKFAETGVETDEETGFSVGIKVANDQEHNRIVVNADCWFGSWGIYPRSINNAGIFGGYIAE